MQFMVVRRNVGAGAVGLAAAAALARGARAGSSAQAVRWIHSRVMREPSGTLTLLCMYQGSSAEAVRAYVANAGQPPDEVLPAAEERLARSLFRSRAQAA